jgi:predicted ATPase
MTGDGMHAVFDDPAQALAAVIDLQLALTEPSVERTPLSVRCGLHLGADQRRDNDFYGPAVNRAARIMSTAHGGQALVSRAVAERVSGRLPADVALRELGAVRLRDLGVPEHLFQLVHPDLRSDFPPLRSMASTPNNLAQQLNSFVGRDREMEQVRQLLANSRLLTLLGMGGLGKSRLSVQVAAVVMEDYPDGVWFVELASLSDPRLVPQAVATALGVREEPGGSVIEALVRYVRDKRLLIVLDNCEHVVQACAELAKALLEAGPRVQVLASSRDSLRVAGENIFTVAPLPAPDKGAAPTVASLRAVDSVRLFVDRATAVQPAFHLNEKTAPAVAEICRRLDGIPLAIELAAARVRTMSVDQIASRVDDRFRLLKHGDRTALPRQQTLRALIDWSHDLLEPKERTLFRRLAVFAGGWTLEAAEQVGASGEVEPVDVVDLLSYLVEKSLVVLEPEGARYGVLDTVRHYALEKLHESPDDASTHERHLAHFLAFVETALPHLFGPEQGEWMTRLDVEHENIIAAHRWCSSSPNGVEFDIRLVSALKYYWLSRGLLGQGYAFAREAIARSPTRANTEIYGRGLVDAGTIATFIGRYEEAQDLLQRGLATARGQGDLARQVTVLLLLGEVVFALGSRSEALDYCDEAVAIARGGEVNARALAIAINAKAQLLRAVGKIDEAGGLYEEALALARDLGDQENVATALLNLAIVGVLSDQYTDALEKLREVASIISGIGSQAAGQSLLEVCAGLADSLNDWCTGAEFVGAAEAQAMRSGLRRDPADQLFITSVIENIRAQLGPTAAAHEATGHQLSYEQAIAHAALWLDASHARFESAPTP